MHDELTRFLEYACRFPFTYGSWDCGRFVASWIKARIGREPGLEYLGSYDTGLQLARIVKRQGGLLLLFDRSFAEVGVMHTGCPARGDVVIVQAPEGPTGAIMLDREACARLSLAGFHVETLPILASWKV